MRINDCILYIEDKARSLGYTERQIACFSDDVLHLVYALEDWSATELDKIVEELF